jgi:release factor glutamine methyltransferase
MADPELLEPPSAGDPVPWKWFLDAVTDELLAAGVDAPGAEARWLLEEASGFSADELYRNLGDPASRLGVRQLRAMLARRLTGEPLQYVLGAWPFRHLDLFVDRRVLIPRPETEVVAGVAIGVIDEIRAEVGAGRLRVVDLGTGSGAIALALAAERTDLDVRATDRSPDALDVARANLAGLGRRGAAVTLHQGIWFSALPLELRGTLDLVVSNPPYIGEGEALPASVVDWEPASALVAGPTGTEALEHLVDESLGWLRPGGGLVLELAPHQADAMQERMRTVGYEAVRIVDDLADRARALVARRPS